MTARPEVASDLVCKLRAICLGLPEACEDAAWTGTRWRIRKATFAHVVRIDAGWPPAYARAAHNDGPRTVLTLRLPIAQRQSPRFGRAPFFKPVWFADIVGVAIDVRTDWDEIEDLLTASFRLLAPKKLAARIDGTGD